MRECHCGKPLEEHEPACHIPFRCKHCGRKAIGERESNAKEECCAFCWFKIHKEVQK